MKVLIESIGKGKGKGVVEESEKRECALYLISGFYLEMMYLSSMSCETAEQRPPTVALCGLSMVYFVPGYLRLHGAVYGRATRLADNSHIYLPNAECRKFPSSKPGYKGVHSKGQY